MNLGKRVELQWAGIMKFESMNQMHNIYEHFSNSFFFWPELIVMLK